MSSGGRIARLGNPREHDSPECWQEQKHAGSQDVVDMATDVCRYDAVSKGEADDAYGTKRVEACDRAGVRLRAPHARVETCTCVGYRFDA